MVDGPFLYVRKSILCESNKWGKMTKQCYKQAVCMNKKQVFSIR